MEEPCPGFQRDWSASAKECKSCELIYRDYARKCKELFLHASPVVDTPKKEVFFKKTHKVNKHKLCGQMLLEGKSKEEIIDALKQEYVTQGHTEDYAKSRIRSIIYNAQNKIKKG